jgi:hypothetical protein
VNARETQPIDITGVPEVLRIVEAVQSAKKPLRLQADGEDVAEVRPIDGSAAAPSTKRGKTRRTPTQADRDAFFSSFGAWKGVVDVAKLKHHLAASRRISRPVSEL